MSATKPALASEVAIYPSQLAATDPVGLPMVDVRASGSVRRMTLDAVDRGPSRGRVGVSIAILGTTTPDEIDDVCADLQAMKAAALAEQRAEDRREDVAREAQELAADATIGDLQAALEDRAGLFAQRDVEVIEDALVLIGQRPRLAATS